MAFLHCELYSHKLRMPASVAVILPQDVTLRQAPARVLYLLHGRSHNYSVWYRYTSLERYCQDYHAAIIMPEANRSFYTDMEQGVAYFSYITEELPALCQSMFHLSPRREDRFISGMSMGGYGCLKAALVKPEFYAACAAISPVTDIRKHVDETPENDPKKKEFRGIFGHSLSISPKDDLYALAIKKRHSPRRPDFYFYCGTDDHLLNESRHFQQHLQQQGYTVAGEEWPGIHDWRFWDTAIEKVLNRFFG